MNGWKKNGRKTNKNDSKTKEEYKEEWWKDKEERWKKNGMTKIMMERRKNNVLKTEEWQKRTLMVTPYLLITPF